MFPRYFPKSQVFPVRFPVVKFNEKFVKLGLKLFEEMLLVHSFNKRYCFISGRAGWVLPKIHLQRHSTIICLFYARIFISRLCAKKKGGRHDSSMKSSKNENCERAEALTSKTFENNFEKHSRGMFPAGQAAQRAAIRSPSLHPVFRR